MERDAGGRLIGSTRLLLPALAAWAASLLLLGCSARTSLITALTALAAMTIVALRRPTIRRWPAISPSLRTWPSARSPSPPASVAPVAGAGGQEGGSGPGGIGGSGVRRPGGPRPESDRGKGWVNTGLAILACVAAVAGAVGFRVHAIGTGPVAELASRRAPVTVEITLTGDPRILPGHRGTVRRDRVIVEGSVELLEDASGTRITTMAPVVVFAQGPGWRTLLPSQRVRVRGRLSPADPGELTAGVLLAAAPPEVLTGPSALQRMAGGLRSGLRQAAGVLPPAERGLLPGLVAGDLSLMDEQVRQDLTTAGLSHLVAVSGANLAIIAGAVVALGRLAGAPLAVRAVLAIVAMLGFAVVARFSPSVLRALVMGSVAAVALGTGRSKDGFAALSATVLILLLFAPGLAREYGFALSVFATGGILALAPRWRDRMARRVPRMVAEAIAVPCAAQAAVTPVLVLMSGQVEPVAIPANLLAGPAVAPATLLGFAAAVVAPFSVEAARWLVWPAGYAVGWIIWVARQAAGLPLATLAWPGGVAGLLLLGLTALVCRVLLRRAAWRLVVCAIAVGSVTAVLLVRPIVASWPPKGWLLVACDVGQGDALVLAAGGARAVVVDTGPDPAFMDRCLRALGVERVPLLILTHPHFDHVGGLDGVFRGRQVGAVVVGPGAEPGQEGARVSADLRRRRVPEWVASPGMTWNLGPVSLRVLGPAGETASAGRGTGSMTNNASVVVHARWAAGSALLSGDVETEAQDELLRRGLPRADILKVPHHGSARQDPSFLAGMGARAALISVGEHNDYGHPALITVSRLRALGMRVYRTDTHGDLAVVADDDHLVIVARGN